MSIVRLTPNELREAAVTMPDSEDGRYVRDLLEWAATAIKSEREEGRREVLREIAAIDPWSDRGYEGFCNFCGACMDKGAFGSTHEPSCLWLKALKVADSDIS